MQFPWIYTRASRALVDSDNDRCCTLFTSKRGDLEQHLRPFIFLSDTRPHRHPLYSMFLIWKREVKLPHERHQECMHLDDPMEAHKRLISFSLLLAPDP